MPENLLSIRDASLRLGLSIATLRKWCYGRKVNYVRLGRAIRFREEDINQLVKQGLRPAMKLED